MIWDVFLKHEATGILLFPENQIIHFNLICLLATVWPKSLLIMINQNSPLRAVFISKWMEEYCWNSYLILLILIICCHVVYRMGCLLPHLIVLHYTGNCFFFAYTCTLDTKFCTLLNENYTTAHSKTFNPAVIRITALTGWMHSKIAMWLL